MISYEPFWDYLDWHEISTYTLINKHHISSSTIKSVEEYKKYAQIIDSKNAHINALKKENPVDLSSTDVGDILNQNDFLRDTVTMKNKEICKKSKRANE